MTPTTIAISLPPEQIEILTSVEARLKKIAEEKNNAVWLTFDELCERIKFKKTKVYELIEFWQLPYCKVGTDKRFNAKAVDEWLLKFSTKDFSEGLKIADRAVKLLDDKKSKKTKAA